MKFNSKIYLLTSSSNVANPHCSDPHCGRLLFDNYLFSSFVEVETSSDQFVSFLSPCDQLLPPVSDPVGNVSNRLGVVVVVCQQRFCSLSNVNRTGMRFLQWTKRFGINFGSQHYFKNNTFLFCEIVWKRINPFLFR